jgi:hypothetical protein
MVYTKWAFGILGAAVGGFYPGALIAFATAAPTGGTEFAVLLVTQLLAIGSSLFGFFVGGLVWKRGLRSVDVGAAISLGLVFGFAGYCWAYWVISNADPPL